VILPQVLLGTTNGVLKFITAETFAMQILYIIGLDGSSAGSQFKSSDLKRWCKTNKVKYEPEPPYYSEAKGKVKRAITQSQSGVSYL